MTELAISHPPARPRGEARLSSDEALLAGLRPLVVRTVRLCVGAGSMVAEDAAQEALLELGKSLSRLEDEQAAPAFAARIAARVAIRMARRERRILHLGLRDRGVEPAAVGEEPGDLLELKLAFDKLPPRQRATAVLRLYAGLSEQETADALECSVGAVKRYLHEARRSLAVSLADSPAPTAEGDER